MPEIIGRVEHTGNFLCQTSFWGGIASDGAPVARPVLKTNETQLSTPMNFLVVDDNRLLNRFLTSYLRGKGHSASSLADSSKVEAWLDLNTCDAVILDIHMPKIDGLSLISQIRENYPDLPIVMFTGLGYDEEAMQIARKAGANGYVSKGLGPTEIYAALMRVLTPNAVPHAD
jgi:DNA-binding response OmpR family regulator